MRRTERWCSGSLLAAGFADHPLALGQAPKHEHTPEPLEQAPELPRYLRALKSAPPSWRSSASRLKPPHMIARVLDQFAPGAGQGITDWPLPVPSILYWAASMSALGGKAVIPTAWPAQPLISHKQTHVAPQQ